MSGAQGAQPKGAFTATTDSSAGAGAGGEPRRTELRSGEDERGLPVKKLEDTVQDAAGKGDPVFGAGADDAKPDLGATGTASG